MIIQLRDSEKKFSKINCFKHCSYFLLFLSEKNRERALPAALPSHAWFVKFSLACIVFLLYIVLEIFLSWSLFSVAVQFRGKALFFLSSDFFVKKENGEVRRPAGNEIQC